MKKEKNENENTAHQNLWNIMKAALIAKLKLELCCLEDLGKKEQNPKARQEYAHSFFVC